MSNNELNKINVQESPKKKNKSIINKIEDHKINIINKKQTLETINKDIKQKKENLNNVDLNKGKNSCDNLNILMKDNPPLQNDNKEALISEPKMVLDEYKKNYVSFLIRLYHFDEKISIEINKSFILSKEIEEGYIINNKIIEIYKKWFKDETLMNLLHQDNNYKLIFIKYKDYQDYIREYQMDSFLKDIIKNLPKEYIKEIKDINNKSFLAEI